MQNLTTINSTLIGLCCIPPHDAQYSYVHSAWKKRFDPQLLVDIVDAEGQWLGEERIVQELTSRNTASGGRLMGGRELLVTVLLDLRVPLQGLVGDMDLLQKRLFRVFRKHCSGLIAFAHAGCIGQEDALYARKKNGVQQLLNAPFSRIFLIASDHCEADGTKPWDTVLLLGDLLRRTGSVLDAFSDRQRLGFLEYTGYQEAKRERIGQQLERIRIRLGNGGEDCIRKSLHNRIDDITADVMQRYVPSADCQPTHEMVSPKNGFIGQLLRFRNRYCCEVVEESVRNALGATGSKLCEDILNVYALSDDEAVQLFRSFSGDVALGLLLDRELVMRELCLTGEAGPVGLCLPERIGSRADVQAYLTGCVEAAVAQGKSNFADRIRNAYADLLARNVFQEERDRIEEEQLILDEEFQLLPDLISFCRQTVVRKKDLTSLFPVSFSGNGRAQAICVCELDRADLLSALDAAEVECKSDMTSTLFCQFTSLRTHRAAEEVPISMLRLKLFDVSGDPDIGTAKE